MKLKEGRFRLDLNKQFFKVRVIKHWNTLPRKVLGALSSEMFKFKLIETLDSLI